MERRYIFAAAAFVAAGLFAAGCSNQNGAGGTVDGTSEQAFELNQDTHLAAPMDSVAVSPDSSGTDSTGAGGQAGE